MIGPARSAALAALRAVHETRVTLPDALADLRHALADPRDAALAGEMLIGTLRWRARLDHAIAARASRPPDRLDPVVLDILRTGAYQLLYLDRIPASAAVHDAVSLAKAHGMGAASGLVNAVLRRIADPRTRPAPPVPPQADDRDAWVDYLSTTWSHPPWLVRRWFEWLGRERTEARLRYNQAPAPVTIRPRSPGDASPLLAALREGGVTTEPTAFAPLAFEVVSGNPWQIPGAVDAFVVQDEASQLVARYAGPEPRQRVLDACASPGGKATLMAGLMDGTGIVVAGDLRAARVRLLRQTVAQSGARNLRVVRHDVARSLPFLPVFDLVLVDAPCSGLGTLRRDPDLKWRRRGEDLATFARKERRLLDEAATAVAPGGRLVYATCSSEPEENDEVARWFADTHPDFRPDAPADAWRAAPLADLITPEGWLRTLPERDGLDAFFAAAFRRDAGGVR